MQHAHHGTLVRPQCYRVSQEPNRNRKPEPTEPKSEPALGTVFQEPKPEPEPCLSVKPILKQKNPFPETNRWNREPEPLEPSHSRPVTEPNRDHPDVRRLLPKMPSANGLRCFSGVIIRKFSGYSQAMRMQLSFAYSWELPACT